MADAYLTFDTKMNTSGFKAGLGQLTGMFSKMAALAGVALSVGAVVAFGKAAVNAASQAQAKWKGLDFLMRANGRSMQQATNFIQKYTADGLVPMTSAYEAYKNMVSRGYSTDQIEKMLSVMKDAAVYNRQGQFSMGEAIEKATMGLRMENSLLTDSVGIQKNVAKMWDEYAKTIGTTAGNLTMAQKRQAEFNGFMQEGGVFAGAAAEYTNSYAGKMSSLSASFLNLKIAVGNAIVPFINALLPAITQAILWFTKLFNIVGQVVNLLFGTNVGMVDAEAAIAGNAEATAAATGETAANTEAAGKAAKGALASFDKLNVLAQESASGTGGGGGGGVPGGGLPTVGEAGGLNTELDALAAKLAAISDLIKNSFQAGDFSSLGESLSNGIIGALTKAREAVQGFDFKGLGTDIGAGFNNVVASIQSFFTNIDFLEIGKQYSGLLSDVFKGMLDTAIGFLQEVDWQNVGKTIWAGITSAIDYVWGWITGVDWGEIISKVIGLLGSALGAAAGLIVGLGTAIWESLKTAWATVKEKWNEFSDEAGGDIWRGITDGAANAVIGVYEFVRDKILKPFIDGFKKAFGIASPSTVMAEQGGYIIDGLKQGIEDAWAAAKDWFSTKVIEPLKGWFSDAWDDIKGFATNAWDGIEEKWATVSSWFETDVLNPVKEKFSDIWEGSDGIREKVAGVWTSITSGEAWGNAQSWFAATWDNVKTDVDAKWDTISSKISQVWTDLKSGQFWGEAQNWFETTWGNIKAGVDSKWASIGDFINNVWEGSGGIKAKWNEAAGWFESTVWTPISEKATEIWDNVKEGANKIAENVGGAIRGAINGVITWFNVAISDIETAINDLINWLNGLTFLGIDLFNFSNVNLPSIPTLPGGGGGGGGWWELAQGAVIPPNAPFAAVMGDQRSGRNLEAPESLIRQIVREESGGMGGNITITFGGTMGELVRQLKPHIERETSRIGGSMMAKAVRV